MLPPNTLEETLNLKLRHGEHILWTGHPVKSFWTIANARNIFFGLAGLLIPLAYGLSFIRNVPDLFFQMPHGAHTFFCLGIVMAGVISWIMLNWSWRRLSAPWRSRHCLYALTEKRFIHIEPNGTTVLYLNKIKYIRQKIRRNGAGDVILKSKKNKTLGMIKALESPQTPANILNQLIHKPPLIFEHHNNLPA